MCLVVKVFSSVYGMWSVSCEVRYRFVAVFSDVTVGVPDDVPFNMPVHCA